MVCIFFKNEYVKELKDFFFLFAVNQKRNWNSVGIRGSWGKRSGSLGKKQKFVIISPEKLNGNREY